MKNLVEKISDRTGMDKEKAMEAIFAISEHVESEFPLLHSIIEMVLGTEGLNMKKNEDSFAADFLKNRIIYN